MVRRTPLHEAADIASSINPVLALPLLAVSIAATVAVIASLCITWFRIFTGSKPEEHVDKPASPPPPFQAPSISAENANFGSDDITIPAVLPLPPAVVAAAIQAQRPPPPPPPPPNHMLKKAFSVSAFRRLESSVNGSSSASVNNPTGAKRSLSLRIPHGLSRIRTGIKERPEKNSEDSIWKKKIMLGEKCKVDEDDEEGSAQRKTSTTTSVSRREDFPHAEAVPP